MNQLTITQRKFQQHLAEISSEAKVPSDTYSQAERIEFIKSLTYSQKAALIRVARAYARKTSYGHEDLIQEAYLRVLGGKREWPRNAALVPFLCGVMRSIAWGWLEDPHDEKTDVELIGYEDRSAASRIDIQKSIDNFNSDPIAQKLIIAMMEGTKGDELREVGGLTQTEYESKRTKIRRRLKQLAL